MRLILLTTAMTLCAAAGAAIAWLTSESMRRARRTSGRSRLAELLSAQMEEEVRRVPPPQAARFQHASGQQATALND